MIIKLMDINDNLVCKTIVVLQTEHMTVSSTMNVIFYSQILMGLCKKYQRRFIEDINTLNELDKWYEIVRRGKAYEKCKSAEERYNLVTKEIENMYHDIAISYCLYTSVNWGLRKC